jgi:hypothetical protein
VEKAKQETQDQPDLKAHKGFKAAQDPQELMVQLVRQAQRELKELPEYKGQPGLVDRLEVMVILDQLVLRAYKGSLE